jgi:hypothetical protein
VLARVDHHILVGPQLPWNGMAASKLGAARTMVVVALPMGSLFVAIIAAMAVAVPVAAAVIMPVTAPLVAAIVAPVTVLAVVAVVRLLLDGDDLAALAMALRKRSHRAQAQRGRDRGGEKNFERHGKTPVD